MLRSLLMAAAVLALCTHHVPAQWTLQDSHTTASLRGIHYVGNGVAWASGTGGTVLRTLDMGKTWTTCAVPPDAEKLDFRGVQGFDAKTAIVMSSGKGDLSRLYKTTDGCATWKLVFRDPYGPDGFFDAILFLNDRYGILLGDPSRKNAMAPVEQEGDLRLRVTTDAGETWRAVIAGDTTIAGRGLHPLSQEAFFAASNTSMSATANRLWFATSKGRVVQRQLRDSLAGSEYPFRWGGACMQLDIPSWNCGLPWSDFHDSYAPVEHANESQGIFAIHFRDAQHGVVVGGDYQKPNEVNDNAAFSPDRGMTWAASAKRPGGYRSAVAYEEELKAWITVGPNGTDISTDDGRNWRPLKPAADDIPDADKNWNALSLPFVVGPKGRIGILRASALK